MYDLIIIGAGPAGLSASIYAGRYKLGHFVVGRELGGTMSQAWGIENYPGFKKISGLELTGKMVDQVKERGTEIKIGAVIEIKKEEKGFIVRTMDGEAFQTKTLVVATGTERRKLKIPGEEEYSGKGVSYCGTCDAPLFKEKTVAVIGGSNAAAMEALHLALFCPKVYLIYRGESLGAEPIWVERLKKESKVEIIYETNILEIKGDGGRVTSIKLDKSYQGRNELGLGGVFIEIGGVPGAALVKPLGVELDEKGYLKVGSDMATNIPGIFGAGDVANAAGELQQVVTAVSEGAIAAVSAYRYLQKEMLDLKKKK